MFPGVMLVLGSVDAGSVGALIKCFYTYVLHSMIRRIIYQLPSKLILACPNSGHSP